MSDGLVTFILLPDAREGEEPLARINSKIRESNVGAPQYNPLFRPIRMAGPRAWHTHGPDDLASTDAMMRLLHQAGWEHPATVALRGDSEKRWSWVVLGLAVPDLSIGEGA